MNVNPRSRYHKLENVNYVVELCQEKLNLQLTNVGGLDILDGNVKILYAVLYKLMRYHSMSIIRKVSGDKGVDEESVVAWTNKRIAENDGSSAITSFRDQSLKTSIFFMDLLEAMKPGVVDWDLLRVEGEEDLMHNAKYVILWRERLRSLHYLRHRGSTICSSRSQLAYGLGDATNTTQRDRALTIVEATQIRCN